MDITLSSTRPHGMIDAIPSKSYAHRLLICAALSDRITTLRCTALSDDITATARCLEAIGAKIDYDGEYFHVFPLDKSAMRGTFASMDCGESGSTLRFMLPVCAALGINTDFNLHGRLPTRPLSPMREELERHGVTLSESGSNPLKLRGQLVGGDYSFDGNVSSQFTTGLLLALPMLDGDSSVTLTGEIGSLSYINMTLSSLAQFGVNICRCENSYKIHSADFVSPASVDVEGDWSNAAFMLSIGALSDDGVTVNGLNPDSIQGDRAIFNLLCRFGAECSCDGNRITTRRGRLHGIEIDAGDIPDLVPTLSVVASVADDETIIKNCGRLRFKESDRLETVKETLSALGADIRIVGDSLVIRGKPLLSGGVVSSFGDHRIAMSAAVASCVCSGSVTITGAEAVAKSYPGFFRDITKMEKA